MAIIQQLSETTFATEARGTKMILEQTKKGWRMKTRNAATRVWGLGGESWKDFDTLADIESKYKSWKGIKALVAHTSLCAH
jgi:hypothetical protein